MLQFLRRHQRYFFVVITIVIVISFSFFGTYSTLEHPSYGDHVVSTSVDGQKVYHSDIEEMSLFIGSDAVDKLVWGGEWGPNFLNDGVIVRDFLQTGLAEQLVEAYRLNLTQELQQRLEKEKRYNLYSNPLAPFISAETIYGYFAPQIPETMSDLKSASDAASPAAFQARAQLYLAERSFPARALRQVLKYQEQQYGWVKPDPTLDRTDLSLFGYHTLEDWFGPKFVRLISQFIINAAKIAERQGYRVTKEEAMADLVRFADLGYAKVKSLPNLGVSSPQQYLQNQLRRMGMDESRAANIWRQILLFRRLFDGVGNAIFVDALPFQEFNQYALARVNGELYQLPEALWLGSYRALQKFEVYLKSISKGSPSSTLALPTQFATVEELRTAHPELVEKRYLLEIVEASAKTLQGQVGVKEMWNWEVKDEHWQQLKQEFPELGVAVAQTTEQRFMALDALNETTRSRVDALARAAIVAEHPDWLQRALEAGKPQQVQVGIRLKGGKLPIAGLEKREGLIALLDQAPLGDKDPLPALQQYSADGQSFYRIRVLDRAKGWNILTFAEAAQDDTLDKMVAETLEAFYPKARESQSDQFRKTDGGWRPFKEVQDKVADLYFKELLMAIEKDYSQYVSGAKAGQLGRNGAASYRLASYLRMVEENLKKDSAAQEQWLSQDISQAKPDQLLPPPPMAEQFKLVKKAHAITRSDPLPATEKEALFNLPIKGWTGIVPRPNGDLWFFQVLSKDVASTTVATAEQLSQVRDILAADAESLLMQELLKEIKEAQAINLVAAERKAAEGDAEGNSNVP